MLKQLDIKNFVFIKNASIEFDDKFNVITGETGAGKSILLNALRITLGQKVDLSLISPGENKILVVSSFDIKNNSSIKKKILSLGINMSDDRLILKREILSDGKTKCYINGKVSNLSHLKTIAERLIDIHSQHQNQHLFNSDHHLFFYDQTLSFKDAILTFRQQFFHYKEIEKKIIKFQEKEKKTIEEKDFLQFSLKEMEGKLISEEHYQELKLELKNLEIIQNNNNFFFKFQKKIKDLAIPSLEKSILELSHIELPENLLKKKQEMLSLIDQIDFLSQEIIDESGYSNIDYSSKIDTINKKLSETESLIRKYGITHDNLFKKYQEIKDKLEFLENLEYEKKKLINSKDIIFQEIIKLSMDLHWKRKEAIPDFERKIIAEMHSLGIKNSLFKLKLYPDFDIDNIPDNKDLESFLNERGLDKVEFLFSPSKEIDFKPLKKIASGGELSRIMLAIKYILNEILPYESMVFDEIDNGVGGHSATKIGEKIKEISNKKQVIVITHLPQIAKFANKHIKIEKIFSDDGQAESLIKNLNTEEIVEEFTRMLGKKVSEENLELTNLFLKD